LPRIGAKVVDENLKSVGSVFDIFGPVSSPYVAVRTSVGRSQSLVGNTLYIIPSAKSRKEKRKR
jgi:RNA-binding protein